MVISLLTLHESIDYATQRGRRLEHAGLLREVPCQEGN